MNHIKMLNNAAIGLLWIITPFLITCSATLAQTQPRIDPNEEIIEFKRLEIKDFNQMLKPITGKKIVPTKEAESLRIVFYSERNLPKSKVIKLVYKYLKECDFMAEEANGVIYIKSNITMPKAEIPLITDDAKLSEFDKNLVVRKVFQLKYVRPSGICPIIGPMLSDSGYSSIDEDARTMLVIDKVTNISLIGKQISELDTETSDLSPDPMVPFNISDETIGNLISALIQWTGKSVILSRGAINRRITIAAPRIIRRSQAISTLYVAIKKLGLSVEETCDLIYIKSSINDITGADTLLTNDVNFSELDKDLIVQKKYKFKYYSLSQMAQIIEPLLSDNGYLDDQDGFLLLVTDKVSVHLQIEKIINRLDTELKTDTRHRVFEVRNRDPNELVELLQAILKNKMSKGSSTQTENEQIVLIPVPKEKWIIARATDKDIDTITEWIKKLESRGIPNTFKNPLLSEIKEKDKIVEYFFYLKHSSPERIAEKIKPLLSDSGYLNAEENTGTVLVIDKVNILLEVEKQIKKLDVNDIPAEDPIVNVNLSSVDINDVVRILKNWTGKAVILSPEVQNRRMTIYSPERMRRSEAINFLYSVIRDYGFFAEETDDKIYLKSIPNKPDPRVPLLGPDDYLEKIPDKDIIVRKVFKLNDCSPSELGKILLPSLNSYGYITAEESSKTLMISDSVETLLRIEQIIKQIHIANQTEKWGYETIQVKYINTVEAAKKLNEILAQMGIDTAKRISIQPLAQTKQVLVFGNETDRKLAKSLIMDLDEQARDKSLEFEMIPVKYVDANELAVSLNQIFNDLTPYELFHRAPIYPFILSNQILIFGKEEYRNLLKIILKEIDLPQSAIEKETFKLKFTDTRQILAQLKELFTCEEMIFLGNSRITSANKPLSSDTVFFTEEPSLMQIVVISSYVNVKKIRELINQWDRQNTDLSKNQDYEVIQVAHIDVNKASDVLNKIALRLEAKNIFIQPLIEDNLLLLFGDKNLIQILKKQIKVIDTQSLNKAQEYDIIPINSSIEVNEVVDALNTILKDLNADFINNVSFVPLSDLNLLLVFGDREYCELIRTITKECPPEISLQRKTFSLKYAKADELQVKINELFNSTPSTTITRTRTSPGNTPVGKLSQDTVITTIYPSLNQIVILAP